MAKMSLPPDKQPPGGGGWSLQLVETGGTVKADDFGSFVNGINQQLRANGFAVLSWEAILERVKHAAH